MPRKIAVSTLNASTIDILNVIRANASLEYQNQVPVVNTEHDIPAVGDVIYGTPAFANQFINALVNRIAFVRVQSATFNNPYVALKKGLIEYGETIETIFVNIANAFEYSAEKAEAREFKRYIPDVKSAFHTMNWRVIYPVTIEDEDLRLAFLSIDGVQDLIARIVDSVYTAAEYDDFLLTKYLLIKSITSGKIAPVAIDTSDMDSVATAFRGNSNNLTFMNNTFNSAGVKTTTPKDRQYIFMDSFFNAQFDVEVLSRAFNMDKADFMGRLFLIDNFATFDNDRFEIIRANSDGLEEVTTAELALMANVKAVIVDSEWFQIYDNKNQFTEKYVASGLYWNYFYHIWRTISYSPFANAIAFVAGNATISVPESITLTVVNKSVDDNATVLTLVNTDTDTLAPSDYSLIQNQDATTKGIAVHPFGAVIYPSGQTTYNATLKIKGTKYGPVAVATSLEVGDTVAFEQAD